MVRLLWAAAWFYLGKICWNPCPNMEASRLTRSPQPAGSEQFATHEGRSLRIGSELLCDQTLQKP